MSSLTSKEKLFLERLLGMSSGYVLDFSNATFAEFFQANVDVEIYSGEYDYGSGSKANQLRGFWITAEDALVGRSIVQLLDYIDTKTTLGDYKQADFDPQLIEKAREIAVRLLGGSVAVPSKAEKAFLEADFGDIKAAIQAASPTLKNVLSQRILEIEAILMEAPLAAIFLIGSTLEGLLLDLAQSNAAKFVAAGTAPKKQGTVVPVDEWMLSSLIETAYELGYVTNNVRDFSKVLRDFRNYIHPRAQAKAGFNPNVDTAKICFQVLRACVTELGSQATGSTGSTGT